tara:strand:+ start:224 stop:490 length:267 start_codon:yes stop_codon:yes gene_type:complete
MQSKTATRSRGIVMLAALLGVLLVKPVFAQEAAEPEAAAVTAPETDATNEAAGESAGAPTVVKSGVVLDYEPTESISEDLSVSFPVDI